MNRVDPRTPVIVGVGQVNESDGDAPEPIELLAEAARRAADDSAGADVLRSLDVIGLIRIVSHRYHDAGMALAGRIGAQPRLSVTTESGGQLPQALVTRFATEILTGRTDAVLIGGVECWKTRVRYRKHGERPPWPADQATSVPETFGPPLEMLAPVEMDIGLHGAIEPYALIESAWRAERRTGLVEQSGIAAALWARFSTVAERNPYAAIRRAMSAEQIRAVGPTNRMMSFPYPKLQCSNNAVDQAAAILMVSVERARALGIPEDKWVYPIAASSANDTGTISARYALGQSPGIREAARAALRLAEKEIEDIDFVDLYSCFPSVVQVAAREIGLPPDRDLTVTGGLTFAGGPWSNYVSHSIATMTGLLRADPEATGMCTANGGLMTKHAVGIYSARPSAHHFRAVSAQPAVNAEPTRKLVASGFEGTVRVEATTVAHDADGAPARAYLACITDDGSRAWGTSEEPDFLAALMVEEFGGSRVRLRSDFIADVDTVRV